MKKLHAALLSVVFVLFIPALVVVTSAQNADAVVEKHLAALGGREALGKLTSRKATGTVTLTTPGGPISGPAEILMKAPNKSRVFMTFDLSALGAAGTTMTLEQRFDGTAAYVVNSMQGETEVSGKQIENLRNNAFPTPLLGYKERGAALEVLPNEKVNGKDAIVLLMTPKTGSPSRMFLDAETYLLVRAVTTLNAPQLGGDVQQTTDVSDYRPVDGVKVPFRVVTANPAQTLTVSLDKAEHNVTIDDAMFVRK